MKKGKLILLKIFFSLSLIAQDSISVFSFTEYLKIVKIYHPVIKQADLLLKEANANLISARGNFDPEIKSGVNQKYFDDKNYYNLNQTVFKIPTWFGVEGKVGYDFNEGGFLNSEDYTTQSGLWNAGVSITLGQGLFIDQRRAVLKQAKILIKANENEKNGIVNDLLLEAINTYWNWSSAWAEKNIYQESLTLSRIRHQGVKISFQQGDRPAIDTVESFIQLQNIELNYNISLVKYNNELMRLSNFLWFENNLPIELNSNYTPEAISEINYFEKEKTPSQLVFNNNPLIQSYKYKLDMLDVDKRLKAEKLKPKIDLNYNALSNNISNYNLNNESFSNYKWGLNFSIPLFLRSERGQLKMAKIKIMQTELDLQQKKLEVSNKQKATIYEINNIKTQITQFTDAVNNYKKMLAAEKQNFEAGESSIFLVNARESNLINSQLKLIELKNKYQKALSSLYWISGSLN